VKVARAPGHRDAIHATTNCSPASRARAVTPSDHVTDELRRIVARTEPSETVTMKSKALS